MASFSLFFATLLLTFTAPSIVVYAQREYITALYIGAPIDAIAWSPDSRFFAVTAYNSNTNNNSLTVFDASNWTSLFSNDSIRAGTSESKMTSVAFSSDSTYVVTGSSTNLRTFLFSGVEDSSRARSGSYGKTFSMGRSPGLGENYLAIPYGKGTGGGFIVLDPDNGVDRKYVPTLAYDWTAISKDGKSVVAGGAAVVAKYALDSTSTTTTPLCQYNSAATLTGAISSHPTLPLLAVSGTGTNNFGIQIFDLNSCVSVRNLSSTLPSPSSVTFSTTLQFSPDGKRLAAIMDSTFTIWDTNTWTITAQFTSTKYSQSGFPYSCTTFPPFSFSPNGKYFAIVGTDCQVKILDAAQLPKPGGNNNNGGGGGDDDDEKDGSNFFIVAVCVGVGLLLLMFAGAAYLVKTGKAKWSNRGPADDPFSVIHNPHKF